MRSEVAFRIFDLDGPLRLKFEDHHGSQWFDLKFPGAEITFFSTSDPQRLDYLTRLAAAINTVPWENPHAAEAVQQLDV